MWQAENLRVVRCWTTVVIAGLVLSGLSAFAIETELRWVLAMLHRDALRPMATATGMLPWLTRVYHACVATNGAYPFLAYGTDWLGFAHLVIAMSFLGAYRDPVRNRWLYQFGLLACAGVFPLAVVAGRVRGIPWGWTVIDCSFGLLCAIPMLLCERYLDMVEHPIERRVRRRGSRPRSVQAEMESWLR